MPIKLQCPDCKVIIKSNNPIPEGRKVRCPKCEHIFPFFSKGGAKVSGQRRTGIELDSPRPAKRAVDQSTRSTRFDKDGEAPPRRKTKVDAEAPRPPARENKPQRRKRGDEDTDETPAPRRAKRPTVEETPAPRSRKRTRDDVDNRSRTTREPKKRGWLFVGIGGVAAALVVAGVCALLFSGILGSGNVNVTRDNFNAIGLNMPKDEVEKVLGKGAPVKEADMRSIVDADRFGFDAVAQWQPAARAANADTWEHWRNGDKHIFVAYTTSSPAPRVGFFVWVVNSSEQSELEVGGWKNR